MTVLEEQQAEALKTLHRANMDAAAHVGRMAKAIEVMLVDITLGGPELDRRIYNSPIEGRTRHSISQRRLQGSDSFAVKSGSGSIIDLMPANPGRLGGQIVNTGTNPIIICLASATSYVAGATASLWLAASGGAWDMTLGKSVYGGPVSVYGSGGTSTLTFAVA